MTTVSVMSDPHLEFADIELPGGDILLLPGDVFIAASLAPKITGGLLLELKQRAIRLPLAIFMTTSSMGFSTVWITMS